MKKFLLSSMLVSSFGFAQVGINTSDPKATLDVVGNPTDTSSKDGIIAPRLTGDQLRAKSDVYGTNQTGTIVYATAADSSPAGKTVNVTSSGYYYFDGSIWQALKAGGAGSGENIYNANGTLTANRTVTQDDKTLKFTGSQVDGFNVGSNALSVDMSNSRLGVHTNAPTNTLDVDGTARIRGVEYSTTTTDSDLVIDSDGVVKKSLKSNPVNTLRAYLPKNFTSGSSNTSPYKISGFNTIGEAPSNFDASTGAFTVVTSGIYEFTLTTTLTNNGDPGTNYVTGVIDSSTGKWIARGTYTPTSSAQGRSYTYVTAVYLEAGKTVYFGVSWNIKVLAHPKGTTGTGLGTYFKIDYLSDGSIAEEEE